MRLFCIFWIALVNIAQIVCANILDVTCINFNPVYDTGSSASYAAILNGADVTSTVSFQRSVDLDTGMRSSAWCSHDDDATECGLPQGSTIDSSGRVTFQDTAQDKFGVYGCLSDRYNWTTESVTTFIRDDAHFISEYFTVTVSLDQEVRISMNTGSRGGSGSLLWRLNHEGGGQTDLSSSVSGNELYISKANKDDHAGIHHYFYSGEPDQGGLVRLIVRACLDNLWGPDCQYTCPTCYNGGVCDDLSGRCVCPPGFTGDHCQTACIFGNFGQDCTGSCSSLETGRTNCRGVVFCLPYPYGCSCAAGWTGLTCDQGCHLGFYGAGCSQVCHCHASASCDSFTGACSAGCEVGWTGDQCQVTVLDIVAILRAGGIYDGTGYNNYLGIFMIGNISVTGHPTLEYYTGREVDTGPGDTGHGAEARSTGLDLTQNWEETGLPRGTTFSFIDNTDQHSLRSIIDKNFGGDTRVGAYRMAVEYRGWRQQTVLLNEYRGDSSSEVWPLKLSTTVGVGETATLDVSISLAVNTSTLRWRHNGGSEISAWNGKTSVTVENVRKSEEGIYECYVSGNRGSGRHAILRLIVRGCPSSKYGFNCSQDCPVCYAGGVCHDVTGECVCRPGFQGYQCEIPCSSNEWGRSCSVVCSHSDPRCPNRLFSPPDPVGLSCINGYTGNRCQTVCDGDHFGADCEYGCHCSGYCDTVRGCQGQCMTDYEGKYCQALTPNLDCPFGYFGTLCNYQCHCQGNVQCQRSNGECPTGVICSNGWAGADCQQALPSLIELPWVSDVTNDSALLLWNAWTDGYDYGNGPVHSYQVDYTWTDGDGNTGEGGEPIIITHDTTARLTGLSVYTNYEFYVSVRRELEGQAVAGVRSGSVTARTDCDEPLLAPVMQTPTVNGMDSITIRWKIPSNVSSSWLRCNSSVYSFNLTYWPLDESTESITLELVGNETSNNVVDGLKACTSYYFSVVIINSASMAGPANHTIATTETKAPESVQRVDFTSDSFNHLRITWSESFSKCGAATYNVTHSLLLRDQCDASLSDKVTWTETHDPYIEYHDLLPYSTYEFTVLAMLQEYEAGNAYTITYLTAELAPDVPPRNISTDNSEEQALIFTWMPPSCGERKGNISYSYALSQIYGEAPQDPITGIQMQTRKSFEDLPHDSAFSFIVCTITSVTGGSCGSVYAQTLPYDGDDSDHVDYNTFIVVAGVLTCLLVIFVIYSTVLTYYHLRFRKTNLKHQSRMNVYQGDKPVYDQSGQLTYEEIDIPSGSTAAIHLSDAHDGKVGMSYEYEQPV